MTIVSRPLESQWRNEVNPPRLSGTSETKRRRRLMVEAERQGRRGMRGAGYTLSANVYLPSQLSLRR